MMQMAQGLRRDVAPKLFLRPFFVAILVLNSVEVRAVARRMAALPR
jgi:hypothetical protein